MNYHSNQSDRNNDFCMVGGRPGDYAFHCGIFDWLGPAYYLQQHVYGSQITQVL